MVWTKNQQLTSTLCVTCVHVCVWSFGLGCSSNFSEESIFFFPLILQLGASNSINGLLMILIFFFYHLPIISGCKWYPNLKTFAIVSLLNWVIAVYLNPFFFQFVVYRKVFLRKVLIMCVWMCVFVLFYREKEEKKWDWWKQVFPSEFGQCCVFWYYPQAPHLPLSGIRPSFFRRVVLVISNFLSAVCYTF